MDEQKEAIPGMNEEVIPTFVKVETINSNQEPDYSKVYVLPTIKFRILSMLADSVVIFMLCMGISQLFESLPMHLGAIRGVLIASVIFLYEPILVSSAATLGQLLMNIRVRNFANPEEKLPFYRGFIRFILKGFLGIISFISVTFNVNRRAIHDFAGGSIMITYKIKK